MGQAGPASPVRRKAQELTRLFLLRLHDRLRRAFRRGLHARWGLSLWTLSRSAASRGIDGARRALRLVLAFGLGSNRAARAVLGPIRLFGLSLRLRHLL